MEDRALNRDLPSNREEEAEGAEDDEDIAELVAPPGTELMLLTSPLAAIAAARGDLAGRDAIIGEEG